MKHFPNFTQEWSSQPGAQFELSGSNPDRVAYWLEALTAKLTVLVPDSIPIPAGCHQINVSQKCRETIKGNTQN